MYLTSACNGLPKHCAFCQPLMRCGALCFQMMIDKLSRLSKSIQFLRLPAIGISLLCLISAIYIIFTSRSMEEDIYFVPSLIGLIWSISTLSFLLTFHSVPEKADSSFTFFRRIGRSIRRGWYWFLGFAFITISIAAIITSYRIISIWLREYGI